jgi:uncharacterized protein (TIGR01244 family)
MTEFRKVTDDFAVAPQIDLADLPRAAAAGFKLVINNRPDGEAPDQPASAEVEAAAHAAGLAYAHVPIRGGPSPEQVREQRALVAEAAGPVLAFCRSGTRSVITWSLGQAAAGALGRDELVRLAAGAGYDLSNVLGR